MADSYVTSQATLKCTFGDQTAKLTVLPARRVHLSGKPMANIGDTKPLVNIAPFGMCKSLANPTVASATSANFGKLTPMPCLPNTPIPWSGGKADYLVQGQPALLKSCTCTCLWAGIIRITDDGQTGIGKMKEYGKAVLDGVQTALDIAGFIPGPGVIADLANAGIYLLRGDVVNASLSSVSAIPIAGDAAAAAKMAGKGVRTVSKAKNTYKAASAAGKQAAKFAIKNRNAKYFVSKKITREELLKHMPKEEAEKFLKRIREARTDEAIRFYENHTNWNPEKIENHIAGIDFNEPVVKSVIPPDGTEKVTLYQYQRLSEGGKGFEVGNYFTANPKATPSELGIADVYTMKGGDQLYMRYQFEVTIEKPTPCLKSTASAAKDTWSVSGTSIATKGGAEQIFIP